ncbi:hypothetical protein F2Q68_00044504 [Brassica cretica]|uniref:Uncharacterized protein n=1 Tax=Brassica cretica TaxID=69181 RepID=A0A8S9LNB7_BRACR|nr:hypothetical protein F2Q68_00044504 [Brassica cretica]
MCKNEEADEEDFRTEKTMSSRKRRASRGDAKVWQEPRREVLGFQFGGAVLDLFKTPIRRRKLKRE